MIFSILGLIFGHTKEIFIFGTIGLIILHFATREK